MYPQAYRKCHISALNILMTHATALLIVWCVVPYALRAPRPRRPRHPPLGLAVHPGPVAFASHALRCTLPPSVATSPLLLCAGRRLPASRKPCPRRFGRPADAACQGSANPAFLGPCDS